MIITQRIEDATKNVQAEGRGLCRVLAVGVLLAVATVAGCVFTGCALLDSIDEADIEKITSPSCTPLTRRVTKERPSRMRSTRKITG